MLFRTHMAIGIFSTLFFLDHVAYKIPFIITALIATALPDIDSGFSFLGRAKILSPLQTVTSHRGVLHSFTFCIALSIVCTLYYPILALPFFLGYGLHLLSDSFTIEGIQPFWPLKKRSSGPLRVGSPVEHALFLAFCILDVVLVFSFFL